MLWFVWTCVCVKSFHKDFCTPDLWSRDFCSLTFDICPVEKDFWSLDFWSPDFCSQVDFCSPQDFCYPEFCACMHFYLHKWKEIPPTGIFTYTNKHKVPPTHLFATTGTLIRELRILESFFSHTSSLHNHSRIPHQLGKFTNGKMLIITMFIIPIP